MLGNTKLVKLDKLAKLLGCNNNIYAKVENTNPTGSIKDRPAFYMLTKLKERGLLKEGGIVIEATSGNMGISLAYFQKELNYKAIIVMPTSMSEARRTMIKQYGATLELVQGGMKECVTRANELVSALDNAILFRQFENEDNYMAHYSNTAKEIEKDIDAHYIFAGIGTGGTISGIGKFYKEYHPVVKIIGVEPYESPLLTKKTAGPHLIQGIGANFVPAILQRKFIDDICLAKGQEAIELAKKIREIEHIDCGYSSGGALLGCINYLKEHKIENKNIVVIFPDKGDRYIW